MEITDEAGRRLFTDANEPKAPYVRPAGPWDNNGPALAPKNPCAWCQPGTVNTGVSHSMCQDCMDREFAKA